MRSNAKLIRIFLLLGLGVMVLASTLLLLYHEPLRMAIVEPATWTINDIRRSLAAVPQALLWGIGLLIGIAVLAATWKRVLGDLPTKPEPERDHRPSIVPHNANAVATLARDLERARRHHVSRIRVARELAILATRLIAKREGLSLEDARKLLLTGGWPDDPHVRRFFGSRRADVGRQQFLDAVTHTLAYLDRYHQEV